MLLLLNAFKSVIAFLCLTRNMVMRELAPQFHIPWSIPMEAEDIPIVPTTSGTMYVLKNTTSSICCSGFLDSLEKSWKYVDQWTTEHVIRPYALLYVFVNFVFKILKGLWIQKVIKSGLHCL